MLRVILSFWAGQKSHRGVPRGTDLRRPAGCSIWKKWSASVNMVAPALLGGSRSGGHGRPEGLRATRKIEVNKVNA